MMRGTQEFPRWQTGCASVDSAAAPFATRAAAVVATDDGNQTDCEDSASRCVIETVLRLSESTESLSDYSPAPSSKEVTTAPAADRHQLTDFHRDDVVGVMGFQNNAAPASSGSATTSLVSAPAATSENLETMVNTLPTSPAASKVRQLVVKFESDEIADLLDFPSLPEGNPKNIFRPGNTIGKYSKTNPARISRGGLSGTSQRNYTLSLDNKVRLFKEGNPAKVSQERSVRIFQKNVRSYSLGDSTKVHKGNSSIGNPFAWRNSLKLDVGDMTVNQEQDSPVRHWDSLDNGSNTAGSQANSDATMRADANSARAINSELSTDSLASSEGESNCCIVRSLGLRILFSIIYYLVLWAVTAALTWGLLELSLLFTSKSKYPFYMSPHSYCITSPAIGFVGCDPEPGKVTTFDNLTGMVDKVDAQLGSLTVTGRDCDSQTNSPAASLSEDALRIPCSMAGFATAMRQKAREIMADRPALLVQIRRHLGYLPAKGPSVKVTCKSDLSLKYFSWNGTAIVESLTGGSVLTDFFPMLTQQHSVPSVLVAIDSASKDDWSGRQVTVKCTPSDGGSGQPDEKAVILVVKA